MGYAFALRRVTSIVTISLSSLFSFIIVLFPSHSLLSIIQFFSAFRVAISAHEHEKYKSYGLCVAEKLSN